MSLFISGFDLKAHICFVIKVSVAGLGLVGRVRVRVRARAGVDNPFLRERQFRAGVRGRGILNGFGMKARSGWENFECSVIRVRVREFFLSSGFAPHAGLV